MMKPVRLLMVASLVFGGLVLSKKQSGAAGAPTSPSGSAPAIRFEQDIRPVLGRCVLCHGPGKAKAGLRLDSHQAAVALLKSGLRAIVPGKPAQSELLRRVQSADAGERMPPRGERLRAAEIDRLRRWIAEGAEWPVHWAYRPLKKPDLPRLSLDQDWARTPVDRFIQATLRDHGLAPAPEADKRTLLRRVYFDLIGLPPGPEEMERFLADRVPDSYERVVIRLLDSPQYGERWARHWMDIVHFAETHGHDQDRPRENAWPYRDYLIRAFNADMPYARFVQEQVCGDILSPGDPWATVATGFLAAGPWDESSLRDIRDDSIDREIGRYLDRDDIVSTVIGTFASTTVHCARCHDHKFDPITQEDYYGLQAVFAGVDKANRPYDRDPQVRTQRHQLIEARSKLAQQKQARNSALLDSALQTEVAIWEKSLPQTADAWRVLVPAEVKSAQGSTLTMQPDGSVFSSGKRPEKDTYTVVANTDLPRITGLRLEVLTDDRLPLKGPGRQDNGNLHLNEFVVNAGPRGKPVASTPVIWTTAKADFDQQGWTIAHAIDGNPATAWGIYPQVSKSHHAVFHLKEPIQNKNGTTVTIKLEQTHGGGHLIGKFRLAATTMPQPADAACLPEALALILKTPAAARSSSQRIELAAYYMEQKLQRELEALPPQNLVYCGTHDFAPDGSFAPTAKPRPIYILKRGEIRNRGPLATPRTFSCLQELPGAFQLRDQENEGSRRTALARWLTDPQNGLAWRSIVNRVWQYHFGRGLVDTPNDFGRMGTPPTHPELLDWLAVSLRESGGSLKSLHRLIVTSAVYRQSTRHNARFAEIDADNRFLWRMNRQRLDAEEVHDAVLTFSGMLDPTMGGPSVKQFIQTPGIHVTPNVDYLHFDPDNPANCRRSVYRFLFRTLPDPFMESLDCPDGSQAAPVRSASVTALQALSLLNDKFVVRQSEHIARRITGSNAGLDRQVTALYRLVLGRLPTPREAAAVSRYSVRNGLANACRVLLNSNEFVFVN